jgi:hypothetical protein
LVSVQIKNKFQLFFKFTFRFWMVSSISHASLGLQRVVIKKLGQYLSPLGILIVTAGGIDGEVRSEMHEV